MQVTCLACAHHYDVPNDTGASDDDFVAKNIFRCAECGARMAYGALAPRLVEEPFTDDAGNVFLRIRIQSPATKEDLYVLDLDPQYAAMHAKNVLSLVIP